MTKKNAKRSKAGHSGKGGPRGRSAEITHRPDKSSSGTPTAPKALKRVRVIDEDEEPSFVGAATEPAGKIIRPDFTPVRARVERIRKEQAAPPSKQDTLKFSHPLSSKAMRAVNDAVQAGAAEQETKDEIERLRQVVDAPIASDDKPVRCDRCCRESMLSVWKKRDGRYGWPDIACPHCGAIGTAAEIRA